MNLSLKFARVKANLKGFYSNFFSGVLGSSATQFGELINATIASFLATGSISYLYYANRVFQLPLALFAIALSQVAFPKILKYLRAGDENLALKFMQKALAFLFLLLCVASLVGVIFSLEICTFLFERGNFSANDSHLTALVLCAYLIGLLPFGLQRFFSLWLYAKFKQKIAALIAIKSLILGVIFALIFLFFIEKTELKVLAIALSSSISGFYLLIANIKEFGFNNFFGLISLRFALLTLIFLSALALFLYEFKPFILGILKGIYQWF